MKLRLVVRGGRYPLVGAAIIIALVLVLVIVGTLGGRSGIERTTAMSPLGAAPTQIPTTQPISLPAGDSSVDASLARTFAALSKAPDSPQTQALAMPAPATATPSLVATPSPTATAALAPTATAVPTVMPTVAATATPPLAATPSPTATAALAPTATAVPTVMPTVAATATSTPNASATPVPTATPAGGITPAVSTFSHAIVARPDLQLVQFYDAPEGAPFTPAWSGGPLPAMNPTIWNTPRILRVVSGSPADPWVHVQVFGSPLGATAWVENTSFDWTSSNNLVQLNLSSSTISVFEGSELVAQGPLRHGRSSAPTPTGDGWLEAVVGVGVDRSIVSFAMLVEGIDVGGGQVPALGLRATKADTWGPLSSQGGVFATPEMFSIVSQLPLGSRVHIAD